MRSCGWLVKTQKKISWAFHPRVSNARAIVVASKDLFRERVIAMDLTGPDVLVDSIDGGYDSIVVLLR